MNAAHLTLVETAVMRPTGRLRITRRGRLVLGIAVAMLVVALLSVVAALSSPNAQAASDGGEVEFGYVVVSPGANLWSLASELDPEVDPRDIISDIVRLNQMPSAELVAGEVLAVPLTYRDAPGVLTAAQAGVDAGVTE